MKQLLSLNVEIDETRNFLLAEINHNDLMSGKYKKSCQYLNYVELLLILASTVTGSISVSALALLVAILVGITISAIGIKICGITVGIKKKESII